MDKDSFKQTGWLDVRYQSAMERVKLLNTVEALGIPVEYPNYASLKYSSQDTNLFRVDIKHKTLNYIGQPKGDAGLLFTGVAIIMVAIIVNGIASGRMQKGGTTGRKGIVLAVIAGVLMSCFYRFVAAAMDLDNFQAPEPGKATPYTAFFIFAMGIFLSNFLWGTLAMKYPVEGKPVSYKTYFEGAIGTHFVGILGGLIWGLGTVLSYIVAGKAGAAISYALGQGAPMVAALWGVFVWHEFKGADSKTKLLVALMFAFFITGLSLIVMAGE